MTTDPSPDRYELVITADAEVIPGDPAEVEEVDEQ